MICKHCKTINSDDAKFCRCCGNKLKSKSSCPKVIYMLALLLISIVIYFVNISKSDGEYTVPPIGKSTTCDSVIYDEIEKVTEDKANFTWYRYKINDMVGVLGENKQVIIDAKYDELFFDDDINFFYAKKNNSVEILKKDGTVFIPISRHYEQFSKECLNNDNNRFYYEVYRKGLYGVCDKTGKEMVPVRFSNLYYDDKFVDVRFHEEDNPIGNYGSFVAKNKKYLYIFDIYIDHNGECKQLQGKKWECYYKSAEYYNCEDATCISSEDECVIRCYGDYLKCGFERYNIVKDESQHEFLPHEAIIDNVDDGGYAVDNNIRMFISDKYMREWKKVRECYMSDFYDIEK